MAYKQIPDDLPFRSEFAIYSMSDTNMNKPIIESSEIGKSLYSYQLFTKLLIHPHTSYRRLLVNNDTGTGKTKLAKEVAFNFLDLYRKRSLAYDTESIGRIIVITFNKHIFYNELISDYATADEMKTVFTDKELYNTVIKRFNDNWIFIGYKAFVNRLYGNADEKSIISGDASINEIFMQSMEGSVIICDEIHKVYNIQNQNTWGKAIQEVSDKTRTTRFLYLSSTVIESSREIVSCTNLLNDPADSIKIEDIFNEDGKMKSTAEKLLRKLLFGKIVYMPVTDVTLFPSKRFIGKSFDEFETIKYIPCEVTKDNLQYNIEQKGVEYDDNIAFIDSSGKLINNDYKSIFHDGNIDGSFMMIDKIAKHSVVDYHILVDIIKIMSNTHINKKGIIFDQDIAHIGLTFVRNMLIWNGLIEFGSYATEKTRCVICSKRQDVHDTKHTFKPATFIFFHNKVDKDTRFLFLTKFNSSSNIMGHEIMIILGGDTIKESIDFNNIRFIMVRRHPSNFTELIQLIGRGSRSGSHINLPLELREVDIYIYILTRGSKISYTLQKYKNMLSTYADILLLERIIHSVAIDSLTNYDQIKKLFTNDNIRTLPYKPDTSLFITTPSKLITSTHDAYFINHEVSLVIIVIKKLFIYISPIWTCHDLINNIRNPPFRVNFNPSILTEEVIVLAIDSILYKSGLLATSNSNHIIYLHQIPYRIIKVGKYYLLCHFSTKHPYEDMFFHLNHQRSIFRININSFVQSSKLSLSYEKKLDFIVSKYGKSSIEQMNGIVCEFDTPFHIRLLEDTIEYINTSIIHKRKSIDSFKIKLLWYYSLIGSVIFASNLTGDMLADYSKYIVKDKKTSSIHSAIIKQELRRTECSWCSFYSKEEYAKYEEKIKNSIHSSKILDIILPVGHIISPVPRYFHPIKGWIYEPKYLTNLAKKYTENSIVIGYNYKPSDMIKSIFKLRDPITSISGDMRKIEKGAVCNSKTRKYLTSLAIKLKINITGKKNLRLCDEIKSRLLLLELMERVKNTNIKWFYQHYEKQPFDL